MQRHRDDDVSHGDAVDPGEREIRQGPGERRSSPVFEETDRLIQNAFISIR